MVTNLAIVTRSDLEVTKSGGAFQAILESSEEFQVVYVSLYLFIQFVWCGTTRRSMHKERDSFFLEQVHEAKTDARFWKAALFKPERTEVR